MSRQDVEGWGRNEQHDTMTTKYSTKEQAERMGKAEAAKLTSRGYPTTLIEVREVQATTMFKEHTMGDQSFDWTSKTVTETKWEAVLSE